MILFFFFFNDTATTEIYTLSLHDALPISNTIAAVKFAPLRNNDRASATDAYEQLDEAAPRPVARSSVLGESSGNSRRISRFETTACTIPERANPRISAHNTCQ